MRLEINTDVGSHMAVLAEQASLVPEGGTVVEYGAGIFSTPMLYGICSARGVNLISFENSPEWIGVMRDTWPMVPCNAWAMNALSFIHWPNLVFIDSDPPETRMTILRGVVDQKAEVILVHDTNRGGYGWDFSFLDGRYYVRRLDTGKHETTLMRRRR